MRCLALACDYDGTIAAHGRVDEATLDALQRLRQSGRFLILVTGRQLDDLRAVFPQLGAFDRVVAENGALLFAPDTKEERQLADGPPPAFIEDLRAREVEPLAVGRAIVATWEPMQTRMLEAVHELGLEYQLIFNKGAVMALPSGINKATGLQAALSDLRLSAHNTVAIGDAENDHALLSACELGVAVANSVPMLRERADLVTRGARGQGVIELIEQLLKSDLREIEPAPARWQLELGHTPEGQPVTVPAWGRRLLLCGSSGSGKSTLATALVEELDAKHYQLCIVDPEGDYEGLAAAIVVGDQHHAPTLEEIIEPLRSPSNNVVANLIAMPFDRRPAFLSGLLSRLQELRTKYGRPHFIVIDEAHHMLSHEIELADAVERLPTGLLMITVHPDRLAAAVLGQVDGFLVVGDEPGAAARSFAAVLGREPPEPSEQVLPPGEAAFWQPARGRQWIRFRAAAPKVARHRHKRKYATGSLGEDKSFYFRGPRGVLNLRAQNLAMFLQIADGVDDATWLYHLTLHHYSRWLREAIKNDELAAVIARIEDDLGADARESRRQVRAAIESTYTLPA